MRAVLGEGPCWAQRNQSLFWVDINTPHVFQWSAARGTQTHPVSEKICSIIPRATGGYIGASYDGLIAISDEFA
ncbi:SMP-30/gluconolactonase/LRE family protein, partial [Sphingorhabdus sp.]|uniref:SMP-30/gluconolactonase/LRE family protein n=1 Tax=Sphingorhabdus sp. TaxID=1902408 RepID=UPI00391DFCEB